MFWPWKFTARRLLCDVLSHESFSYVCGVITSCFISPSVPVDLSSPYVFSLLRLALALIGSTCLPLRCLCTKWASSLVLLPIVSFLSNFLGYIPTRRSCILLFCWQSRFNYDPLHCCKTFFSSDCVIWKHFSLLKPIALSFRRVFFCATFVNKDCFIWNLYFTYTRQGERTELMTWIPWMEEDDLRLENYTALKKKKKKNWVRTGVGSRRREMRDCWQQLLNTMWVGWWLPGSLRTQRLHPSTLPIPALHGPLPAYLGEFSSGL